MGRHPATPGPALKPLAVGVRRARADDKPAILAFATRTWDGWDYIPEAWDPWLAAEDGIVLVVELGEAVETPEGRLEAGQPIAMSRVAMLSEVDAWLEGIRVDPRLRGRGVATALQVAELAWARAQGATWVRYATGELNEGSHRLGARHGIRILSRWRWYAPRREEVAAQTDTHTDAAAGADADADAAARADADADSDAAADADAAAAAEADADAAASPPEPTGPTAVDRHLLAPGSPGTEVARLWALIDADPTFALGQRLYESRSWAFQPLTEKRFAAHVRAAEVHVSPDRRAAVIAPHRAGWSEDHRPHVAIVCGDGAAALELLVDLREAFGGELNVRLPAPDPPMLGGDLVQRWAAAGFGAWGRHELHILGRPLVAGDRARVEAGGAPDVGSAPDARSGPDAIPSDTRGAPDTPGAPGILDAPTRDVYGTPDPPGAPGILDASRASDVVIPSLRFLEPPRHIARPRAIGSSDS